MNIDNKIITTPSELGNDGLAIKDGTHWTISNCIVDMKDYYTDLSEVDEAIGIVKGSSATFNRCIIRNASKLILAGTGDNEDIINETGKQVFFYNCLFENFGRRGPEVQNGMEIYLDHCVIRNWNHPEYFDTRSFASWAHHNGKIYMSNCVFIQDSFMPSLFLFIKDFVNGIGQAWNDEKLKGLFKLTTYIPGSCKGAFATCNGYIDLNNCYKNKWWIYLENSKGNMDKQDAELLISKLEHLYTTIGK